MRAAPAVSCARLCEKTHTSIQVQRRHSGIPCAMALRLISCSPRRRIPLVTVIGELAVLSNPVGPTKTSADLTPATGARTTRFCRTRPPHAKGFDGPGTHPPKFWRRRDQRRSSARGLIAHEPLTEPPCDCLARPTLPRPPHPMPNVRDDHDTPDGTSGIFSPTGLDSPNHVEVAGENRRGAHGVSARKRSICDECWCRKSLHRSFASSRSNL
jgi:hypothetical protein